MNYEMKIFEEDIIKQSFDKPVLVDFWAEWCGPCRVLSPILEKLAEKYKDQWSLIKINTDENQEIAVQFGIRGIPNVKLFYKGKVINEFTGAIPEKTIEEWLKKAVPTKTKDKLEEVKKLLSNYPDKAKKILEDILSAEPDNAEANILLAKTLVFKDAKKALHLINDVNSNSESTESAEAIKTFIGLFEKVENKNLLSEAEVKEDYVTAVNELKNQNFDFALEKFISVIRSDRSYDDDGARKACIAIFKFLGEENEITLKYRKDFGRALYI